MINLEPVIWAHQNAVEAQYRLQQLADERNRLVAEALAQGVSAVQIAEALGVNRARIYVMSQAHTKTIKNLRNAGETK